MAFDTVANLISDAALELGLVSSAIADPYTSTDPNIVQLRARLKSLGRKLVKAHDWSQLISSYSFSTVDGTLYYDLPSDFDRFVDQTGWNRTTDIPLNGPASPQLWHYFQALSPTGTVNQWFRQYGNKFYIYPVPSGTETCAFEYISTEWAKASDQIWPNKDAPTVSTDEIWFERTLIVDGLKYGWESGKGFPSDASMNEYIAGLNLAKGQDAQAPVLSLNGRKVSLYRDLDSANVPETGYGS